MKQELNEISDLMLERFVAGELDAKRNAQIQMFCETDSVLQERVNGIRKSNEEILTAYEPKAMAIAIQRRQQTRLQACGGVIGANPCRHRLGTGKRTAG